MRDMAGPFGPTSAKAIGLAPVARAISATTAVRRRYRPLLQTMAEGRGAAKGGQWMLRPGRGSLMSEGGASSDRRGTARGTQDRPARTNSTIHRHGCAARGQ